MTMYDDNRVVTLLREIDPPLSPPDRLQDVRRRARRGESRRASALAGVMAVVLAAGVIAAVQLPGRGTEVLSVAGAARATQDAGTARITVRMTLTDGPADSGLPSGPMELSGVMDFEHGRYLLKGTSFGQQTETRVIGKDRWTKIPAAIGFGNIGGKPWFHSMQKSGADSDFLSDVDPAKILQSFMSKGRVISTEQVGDRTRTVVRLPADAFGPSTGSAQVSSADVTTETDAEGRIRMVRSQVVEASIGTLTMELRFDDFGINVDVQPPPVDQVQEAPSTGTSGTSQHFTLSTGSSSSPEDRKKACDAFKAFVKQQPAPKTDQEKAQRKQFEQAFTQACATS